MMDFDKLLSFMMKKDMTVKEATSIFGSKYYAFTHKIQVSGDTSEEWLVNYLHESKVVEKIEMVLGGEITEFDHVHAILHMSLQHSGKTMKSVFESEQFRMPQIDDLKELLNDRTPFIKDFDKYAEINFEDAYRGMKSIVKLSEEIKS